MGFSLKKLAGIAVGVVTGGLASSLASQYFLGGAKPKGSTVFEDGSELATAAEGVPIRRMYSHLNRVTGTVVVLGPIEVVTTSRGIVHNHADLMVLWGEGEVNDITKIWTDNVQLFGTDGESDFDETSNDVSVADASNDRARYTSDSSAGGPNYLELDVGQDVTISGCTNAGNNLTTSVIAKGITQDGNDDTFFVIANASAVTEAAGANIRVEQDKPNYSTLAADSITNVEGSGSETVNTILDSLNPDRTPAYRFRAHTIIERLRLKPFGNRIPKFEAEIEKTATADGVGDVLGDILEDAGLTSSQYDVSNISDTVEGYTISGPEAAEVSIGPLMTFGDLVIQEDSGKLRIFPRTYPTAYSIDEGDLGAVIEGESRPGIIAFQDVASVELPRMLALEFKDKSSTDFEQASVTSRRNELTFDTNPAEFKFDRRTEVVNLPIIMTQATAQTVAARLHHLRFSHRQEVRFTLGPKHALTQEGDRITIAITGGETYTVLITSIERGNNFIHRCTGFLDDGSL